MSGKKVLVLGATGGIGSEMVRQLLPAGWQVRALHRQPQSARDGIDWLVGDAMDADAVRAAAQGCGVIIHALNPPGYRRWADRVLPMLDNSIAAAIDQGATLVLPGTVYNFGPDSFARLHEDSEQRPLTRKGVIRVQMEARLNQATARGMRVIIVRAGDFFGPGARNNWFSQGLIKPGRPVRQIGLPGAVGVGHQWAYLPDVARVMMQLLALRETLAPFAVFHLQGHWDADGRGMAEAISRAVVRHGGQAPVLKAFAWWLVRLAAPFAETCRELLEMRYLWQVPVRMNNARLVAVLGEEPHTPLDQAVETSLHSLGCLPNP